MKRRLKYSEKTAKEVQEAFLQLLQESSYEKITVKDITVKAGINRTTFYLIYENKQAILFAIFSDFSERYILSMMDGLMNYSRNNIKAYYIHEFAEMAKYSKMLKTLWEMPLEESTFLEKIQNDMIESITDYLNRKNFHMKYGGTTELFANLYAAEAMTTLRWWTEHHEEHDVDFIARLVDDIQYNGLFHLLER